MLRETLALTKTGNRSARVGCCALLGPRLHLHLGSHTPAAQGLCSRVPTEHSGSSGESILLRIWKQRISLLGSCLKVLLAKQCPRKRGGDGL